MALARDTAIGAPRPLAARHGAWRARAATPGGSGGSRCLVLSWVPGRPLGRHLTVPNLEKMGALFARLHAHGAAFVPPEGFTPLRLDRLLARGETDVLFAGETLAALPMAESGAAGTVCVRAVVDAAYTRRYSGPAAPQVIHDDLWHDNIHLYRGRLYPLDFEDTCWGYPVQDLAMALQDLMDDTEPDDFEPLQAALRRGYERLSPWPEEYEGEADTFRAGRTLWVANFVAAHQRE
jgi:Ser/Thr protein kinase RdoA (MazF antagonist)